MVLTPSSVSSGLSGFSFWGLVWATVCKVDTIPVVKRFVQRDKVFKWVNKNKATAILLTEVTNFGIHGVENPNAVMMAVGGSVMNTIVVFLLNPFYQWRNSKNEPPILRGI